MSRPRTSADLPERILGGARWLLPGGLIVFLAFESGGYFPASVATVAAMLLLLLVAMALAAREPVAGWGRAFALAAGLLLAFAGWTYLSSAWSGSTERAALEADRVLLYFAILLVFGSWGWTPSRGRALALSLAAGIAVVCALAVGSRLLPGLLDVDPGPKPERLSYPVTYWNALGLLAGFGCILGLHLAASADERPWARALGAALVPLAAATLLLTISRSGVWATAAGLVVYLLVARPRGLPGAALAIVPTTGIALLGLDHGAVVGTSPADVARYDLGGQPTWILGVAMVVAAAIRIAMAPLDRRLIAVEIAPRRRRLILGAGAAAVVVTGVLGLVVARDLGLGREAYDRFVAGVDPTQQEAAGRLTSLSNNNRISKWRAAMDEFREEPLHGSGAGTYELVWQQRRPTDGHVLDAHSLYVEVLGELGLVGLVLLAGSLLVALGALARRSAGPGRAAPAAALAVAVAWLLSAGVDWDWEMAVVTAPVFMAAGLALGRSTPAAVSPRRRLVTRIAVALACCGLMLLPVRILLSESRLDEAGAAVAQGDCATGGERAREALDAFSGSARSWQLLGYCALRERRWPEAETAMERAAARDQRNWAPVYGLAVARAAAGADFERPLAEARLRNPRDHGLLALEAIRTERGVRRALRTAARRAQVPRP